MWVCNRQHVASASADTRSHKLEDRSNRAAHSPFKFHSLISDDDDRIQKKNGARAFHFPSIPFFGPFNGRDRWPAFNGGGLLSRRSIWLFLSEVDFCWSSTVYWFLSNEREREKMLPLLLLLLFLILDKSITVLCFLVYKKGASVYRTKANDSKRLDASSNWKPIAAGRPLFIILDSLFFKNNLLLLFTERRLVSH